MNNKLTSVLNNSAWLLLERGIRLIGIFYVNTLIAKYLGPEKFGIISYFLTIMALLWGLANLGADGIIVRELATRSSNPEDIFKTAVVLRIISGALLYITSTLIIYFTESNFQTTLLWLVAGIPIIFQAVEVIDLKFQSVSKSKLTAKNKILALLLSSSIKLALISFGAPLWSFIAAIAFEYIIFALALIITYLNSAEKNHGTPRLHVAKSILMESWPILLSGVGIFLYWKSDQLLIQYYLGNSAVGLYTAATSISQLPTNIPTILFISLAPYLAKLYESDKKRYYKTMSKLFKYGLFGSLFVAITGWMAAEQVVYILYGKSYKESVDVLRIHIFTNIPIFIGIVQSSWFILNKKTILLIPKVLIGALMCIFLNFLLIPRFEIMGAAIATLTSTLLVDIFIARLLSKDLYLLMIGKKNDE